MAKAGGDEPRESSLASGWTVEAEAAAVPPDAVPVPAPDAAPVPDAAVRPEFSNAALVLLGVFGGLYLLYAWVWLSWAQFYSAQNAAVAETSGLLGAVLQQIVFWAAPLAPILWFLAALLMNRRAGMRRLSLWVVVGAILLVPLPAFGGGGAF